MLFCEFFERPVMNYLGCTRGIFELEHLQAIIYKLSEKTQSVFLKSVPIELTETKIKESLEGQDLSVKKVTRLTWRKTGLLLSVVKLIL